MRDTINLENIKSILNNSKSFLTGVLNPSSEQFPVKVFLFLGIDKHVLLNLEYQASFSGIGIDKQISGSS